MSSLFFFFFLLTLNLSTFHILLMTSHFQPSLKTLKMTILRTPKGTIDFSYKQATILDNILHKCTKIFHNHSAKPLRTPIFELKSILTNKYGDDSKLIFDLADQGGDICSLRYDLTVPFARFLAQNNIIKMRRYQIGEVFRRDQPALTKGRYREFVQCDFDIAGSYARMCADAETIKVADECLAKFCLGKYVIKISHRKLLSAILSMAGVESGLHSTVCSTIDKMHKMRIEDIRKELIGKGCSAECLPTVEKYVNINGSHDILIDLKDDILYQDVNGKEAIDDLLLLSEYLKVFKVENIVFDLSLARGTDYYTGLIFEAEYSDHKVGSVLGGGRYDNLVNDFVTTNSAKTMNVPCVGFSVGVMRIYSIMCNTQCVEEGASVFVGTSGGTFLLERMSLLNMLWASNISAETYYTEKMSFGKQSAYCTKNNIKFMILMGENEIENGFVQVCDNATNKRENVRNEELVKYLKQKIDTITS